MSHFDHLEIDKKWQEYWSQKKTFKATEDPSKKSFYALDMFPYPSGAGLHVGHPLGYTATDIISRYKRHQGYNVLHPMGWDAFGLPAENYAIKTGVHPSISTAENEANFKRQIESLGFSYDWDRCFSTTDPAYYRWSQWIFLQLYKKGLAYEKAMPMNWCPECKVVVANEEVENGRHERCGTPVEKRNLKQWMFRITDYAERLLNDLDDLPEWPEKIKAMQRNWIGRSEGIDVAWHVADSDAQLRTYTTTVDTIAGVTFAVISPEYPNLDVLITNQQKPKVETYLQKAAAKSELERTSNDEKTGVFTGTYIVNPITRDKVPLYVADYVLMSYGTGVVMGVPAHDKRDHEFATKYQIPIIEVIETKLGESFFYDDVDKKSISGTLINSGDYDGLDVIEAREKISDWLESKSLGERKVNYKLRDWIFTRQRYWGEPIPVVFDEAGNHYPLDDSELPLVLPETPNYQPSDDGKSPLAKITDWVNVKGDITPQGTVVVSENGKQNFTRETSTMPNWAGSSWYWLRFMDPNNDQEFCSKEKEQYWGPVDLYVGGAEHAVLHLLYARFWHKVLFDLGLVSSQEPFQKLVNQGMIAAEDGRKMSKSLGNVINPDDVVRQYGADTLRCYEMFMGPFEQGKFWNENSVSGIRRWLDRVWRLEDKVTNSAGTDQKVKKQLHKTIKSVGEDIEAFKFNTAVSSLMEMTNTFTAQTEINTEDLRTFLILLSPFAPHMAEEMLSNLGQDGTSAYLYWPDYDESFLVEDTVTYAVQVNGKLRGDFACAKDADKETVISQAKAIEKIAKYLAEGEIKKEIFVPGKIIGFVVK